MRTGWYRSTKCESQHCVEVTRVYNKVGIRDSANPSRKMVFSANAWRAFLTMLR